MLQRSMRQKIRSYPAKANQNRGKRIKTGEIGEIYPEAEQNRLNGQHVPRRFWRRTTRFRTP